MSTSHNFQNSPNICYGGCVSCAYFSFVFFCYQIQPIVNGVNATKFVPWVAALEIFTPNKKSHYCQGSLITDEHLLTAGHCFCYNKVVNCKQSNIVTQYICQYCVLTLTQDKQSNLRHLQLQVSICPIKLLKKAWFRSVLSMSNFPC